jgi:hypothetical protein
LEPQQRATKDSLQRATGGASKSNGGTLPANGIGSPSVTLAKAALKRTSHIGATKRANSFGRANLAHQLQWLSPMGEKMTQIAIEIPHVDDDIVRQYYLSVWDRIRNDTEKFTLQEEAVGVANSVRSVVGAITKELKDDGSVMYNVPVGTARQFALWMRDNSEKEYVRRALEGLQFWTMDPLSFHELTDGSSADGEHCSVRHVGDQQRERIDFSSVKRYNRIHAIKLIRDVLQCGLKEAKEIVDGGELVTTPYRAGVIRYGMAAFPPEPPDYR